MPASIFLSLTETDVGGIPLQHVSTGRQTAES